MKNVFLLLVVCFLTTAFSISPKLEKKINKMIINYFETEEFSKELITIAADQDAKVPSDFKENLFKITDASGLLGYVYLGNAPSKTATFDYLVLFDTDFIVKKSNVLIYREEYGGEIGSKRWLKQFNGKSSGSEIKFPQDITPISGATISVRSMSNAINDVLQSIKTLQENNVL